MKSKTTVLSYVEAVSMILTLLASLPYELGGAITDPVWKVRVFWVGLVATAALKVWKGHSTADANPPKIGLDVSSIGSKVPIIAIFTLLAALGLRAILITSI